MKKQLSLLDLLSHDAFRYGGGLNKSAAEIYWFLLQGPKTAKDLINQTGRSRRTVYRALERMSKIIDLSTGEIINMVEKDGLCWRALETDLNHISLLVGTAGIGRKQVDKHKSQRKSYRKSIRFKRKMKSLRKITSD